MLRGRRYTVAHVGDSRAYLLRAGELTRLTRDHVWDRPELGHVLTRGVGLDARLNVDIHEGELEPGDRWLLVTDGVWGALPEKLLAARLAERRGTDVAQAVVDAALARGASDNVSALALEVCTLGEDELDELGGARNGRAALRRLDVGAVVDGLRVDALLHESVATRLYRVTDLSTQRELVLKTLSEDRAADPAERARFAREEWLARRVVARFFAQVVQRGAGAQSALYYLQTWHAGETLRRLIDRGGDVTLPEALRIAIALARAIGALHRRSILHRDVKPENLHLGDDGQVRLLDFGVAQTCREAQASPRTRAGTPSYLAPELVCGAGAAPQTDIYAVGVTLYHALTRRYPYGEIEPFQRPHFGEPTPPTRYRPELPHWFENIILKAIERDPAQRFETADELLLALERGAARPLPTPRAEPLAARNPVRLWQSVALLSVLANLALVYVLLVRSAG